MTIIDINSSKMRPGTDILADLTNIKLTLKDEQNDYHLSKAQKYNANLVIDTLIYIVKHINALDKYHSVYHAVGIAPIHLENHPVEFREATLIGSLVEVFINCFNNVKAAGKDKVKVFCSKLSGGCVEMRTRKAFDYGYKFGAIYAWDAELDELLLIVNNLKLENNTAVIVDNEYKDELAVTERAASRDDYFIALKAYEAILRNRIQHLLTPNFNLTNTNNKLVSRLIKHYCRANPNEAGITLHQLLQQEINPSFAHYFIEHGANINITTKTDKYEINNLHFAICKNKPESMIKDLLLLNCDGEDDNLLAFQAGIAQANLPIVTALVEKYPLRAAEYKNKLDGIRNPWFSTLTYSYINELGMETPAQAESAKFVLLRALIQAEQEGFFFNYTLQDKNDFIRITKNEINNTKSIAACIHIYNTYAFSRILAYHRLFDYGYYTTTKINFIELVQSRIIKLASSSTNLSAQRQPIRHQILLAYAEKNIFTPAHIIGGVNKIHRDECLKLLTEAKSQFSLPKAMREKNDPLVLDYLKASNLLSSEESNVEIEEKQTNSNSAGRPL